MVQLPGCRLGGARRSLLSPLLKYSFLPTLPAARANCAPITWLAGLRPRESQRIEGLAHVAVSRSQHGPARPAVPPAARPGAESRTQPDARGREGGRGNQGGREQGACTTARPAPWTVAAAGRQAWEQTCAETRPAEPLPRGDGPQTGTVPRAPCGERMRGSRWGGGASRPRVPALQPHSGCAPSWPGELPVPRGSC